MDRREARDLDNHITGHGGEDVMMTVEQYGREVRAEVGRLLGRDVLAVPVSLEEVIATMYDEGVDVAGAAADVADMLRDAAAGETA